MAAVRFSNVDKVFPDGTRAVNSLTLAIEDGEFMVLVGPSGCGKTTALRMLAGLEDVSAGSISIGDTVVNDLEPRLRDVAMVFQNYALYPHMTVAQNIGFGLKMRKMSRADIERRVSEIASILDLADLVERKPRQLSGGQRQRVAMGRAIVREPQVFLMDEPLSNLDAKLRVQMRSEISGIQRGLNATTIYVTHDQVEAMTMGDRVAVMRAGELQQVDRPEVLYDSPANIFVASFIGSPAMSLARALLVSTPEGVTCAIGDQSLSIPQNVVDARPTLAGYDGKEIAVGMRPEHLEDVATSSSGCSGRLRGTVTALEMLGSQVLAHIEVVAKPVVSTEILEIAADIDATAASSLQRDAERERTPILAQFSRASAARVGDVVELAVATQHLHLFDLATGRAIH